MHKHKSNNISFLSSYLLAIILISFLGCNKDDNTLAPYTSKTNLSNITLEKGSFKPKITWIGGYASVLGVNHGSSAALDSSLIWLIHVNGNNLHYPVTFNQLPAGVEDITVQYGGTKADSLNEDDTYTFWVLKEEVWNQLSSQKGKYFSIDSTLKSTQLNITADSVQLSTADYVDLNVANDVYVNIKEFRAIGKLGVISLNSYHEQQANYYLGNYSSGGNRYFNCGNWISNRINLRSHKSGVGSLFCG